MEEKIYNSYGSGHSKRYSKSILSDFLVSRSTIDDSIHFSSDVNLLLRQKNIHKTIGIDVLRSYVENLDLGKPESHNFTDDELLSILPPKEVNTITDCYQFSKYLKDHEEKVNENYEKLKKYRKEREDYKKFLESIKEKGD